MKKSPDRNAAFSMTRQTLKPTCLATLISMIVIGTPVFATTYNITPAHDWVSILNDPGFLQPGDELIFSAGTYSAASRLSIGYQGTAADPITLRAADGATVVITRPDANQNVINLEGAQYLTLQGLEVTGGSTGIRIGQKNGDQAKFITLDGNHIHHVGGVGVTANFSNNTYEGMHFLNNEIHHTTGEGEGFYLGCNNDACQFFDGIIEKNYIHDTKSWPGHTVSQGDGIEIKFGSYNNIVRDNVIHDTNYPGMIAYGTAGNGDRNVFERNVVWNSSSQTVQIAADAIIRNNLILGGTYASLQIQSHQGADPGNLTIMNNTIVADNVEALRISQTATAPILMANNAIYSKDHYAFRFADMTNLTLSNNIGEGQSIQTLTPQQFDPTGDIALDFTDLDWTWNPGDPLSGLDAFPIAGSKLIDASDWEIEPADDFNTTSRGGTADVGAYVYHANGNPGWQVGPGFKQFPPDVGLTGDYNDNGVVEQGDLDLVLLNWGDPWLSGIPGWIEQQPTDDGVVDQNDLDGVLLNWGRSATVAAGVVPEPSSFALMLLAGLLAGSRRLRGNAG